jgi:hypothetical protein
MYVIGYMGDVSSYFYMSLAPFVILNKWLLKMCVYFQERADPVLLSGRLYPSDPRHMSQRTVCLHRFLGDRCLHVEVLERRDS